jgi:hypothetical protein
LSSSTTFLHATNEGAAKDYHNQLARPSNSMQDSSMNNGRRSTVHPVHQQAAHPQDATRGATANFETVKDNHTNMTHSTTAVVPEMTLRQQLLAARLADKQRR